MPFWSRKHSKQEEALPQIPRALVLGGGGSKGAYQVGVWQAFRELGLRFPVVTGTSVGALNGALIAQDTFDEAYQLWWNMDNTKVLKDIPPAEQHREDPVTLFGAYLRETVMHGGVDASPLEALVKALVDEEKLRGSGVELGIVTVGMGTMKPVELFLEEIPPGQVADYLMASASFFPAMQPKKIGGKKYIDGGYHDNIPIAMALRAKTPVEEVLVVDVDGIGFHKAVQTTVPVQVLRSYWNLGSIMVFDQQQIRRNIKLGYLDGLKHFGRLEGRAYGFAPGTTARLEQESLEELTEIQSIVLEGLSSGTRLKIDKLVTDRLTGSVARRRKVATPRQMLVAAVETAGELLDLDPTVAYTLAEYDRLLLEKLGAQRKSWTGPSLSLEDLRGTSLPGLVEGVREAGREYILLTVLDNLRQQLTGAAPALPPEAIALLAPREFVGALYLLLLERRTL